MTNHKYDRPLHGSLDVEDRLAEERHLYGRPLAPGQQPGGSPVVRNTALAAFFILVALITWAILRKWL